MHTAYKRATVISTALICLSGGKRKVKRKLESREGGQ